MKMDIKVFLLLGLVGIALCDLEFKRTCEDKVGKNAVQPPSLCSNYKNIENLDSNITTLDELQKNTNNAIVTLETQLKEKTKKLEDLEARLAQTDQKVNELQAADNNKVAFSASITEGSGVFTGPKTANSPSVLIFNHVFTNIGNAYNKKTGIFTAPVEGVYQFTFMTFGYNTHTSGAILVKNGHLQVSTYEFQGPDASDTTSNTVVLHLKPNDCINIILWQGGKIHTGVFSGFLLFTV